MLEATFSQADVRAWGPPPDWDERAIRAIFRRQARLSVDRMLRVDVAAGVRFWAVMREHLIPRPVIHELAQGLVERVLERALADGVYADFRSLRAIEAKRRWNARQSSSGVLSTARLHAQEARETVALHEDPRAWHLARTAWTVCDTDARRAFRASFYSSLDLHGTPADQQACVDDVIATLQRLEARQ